MSRFCVVAGISTKIIVKAAAKYTKAQAFSVFLYNYSEELILRFGRSAK